LRRRSHSVEQLAVRHSNCFFCDNFQESTQDSFIYPVILHNVISSVRCRTALVVTMDMLRRLINNVVLLLLLLLCSNEGESITSDCVRSTSKDSYRPKTKDLQDQPNTQTSPRT